MGRYGTRSTAGIKGAYPHLNAEEAIAAITKNAADKSTSPPAVTAPISTRKKVMKKVAAVGSALGLRRRPQKSKGKSAATRSHQEPSKQTSPEPAAELPNVEDDGFIPAPAIQSTSIPVAEAITEVPDEAAPASSTGPGNTPSDALASPPHLRATIAPADEATKSPSNEFASACSTPLSSVPSDAFNSPPSFPPFSVPGSEATKSPSPSSTSTTSTELASDPSDSPHPSSQSSSDSSTTCHLNLSSSSEAYAFLHGITTKPAILHDITSFEIHLNAAQHTKAIDDRLAMLLSHFKPNPDGTNPHSLQSIKIVFHGNIIFTRYNYTMVSPAISSEITNSLHKLMAETRGLSIQQKKELAYKINATEKSVSKALLSLRGIPHIIFEAKEPAAVELGFSKLLRQITSLPPATLASDPIAQAIFDKYEAGMSREGEFWSGAYDKAGAANPYPLKSYDDRKVVPSKHLVPHEYGWKTKVPISDNSVLLGQLLGRDEKVIKKDAIASAPPRGAKRKVFHEDKAPASSISSNKRRKVAAKGKGKKAAGSSSDGNQDEMGMHQMSRILARQQTREDLGAFTGGRVPIWVKQGTKGVQTGDGTWLSLTGPGNQVQLGWKTT